MAVEQFVMVECIVDYNDGTREFRYPTIHQISSTLGGNNFVSAAHYLHSELKNVKRITIHDVLHFKSEADYNKYIESRDK